MALSPRSRLGSYEIITLLGAGGMGEVYRARDSRLGREIALKVLPSSVTAEPGRLERFDREARAIAALNHPNIVTIYSTEEADGLRFLTMELVEGQTLGELVVAGGVSLARFFQLALPLADALTAAHQKQITHRDLKPGNVMVSDEGRVKVLDFGLARIATGEHAEHSIAATLAPVTQHGMIVGTMPYMSPEQVEGGPLDTRSDLFSLGVILYELLTGERPFHGPSSPALLSSILRDTPSPITMRRADVPEPLARLVGRCLEKRREDRVQTARDVYNELRHVQRLIESSSAKRPASSGASPTSVAPTRSIAVLPFTARNNEPDAEAIAVGLTEDITASMAKFPGLSVVAMQSARVYKDSTLDARQIAERLNARYILSGSVRKAGPAVRVTAHIVDAHTAATLWSETYDRRVTDGDIFTVQDDLTDHIVGTVADQHGVLAKSMVEWARQQTTLEGSSVDELVLRAWGFQHNPTPGTHAELRDVCEARVQAEPANSQLWAMLAHLYMVEHSLWFNARPEALERAQRAARRALELDSSNQQGWETLAMTCFYLGDRRGLEETSERAIRINPRNAHTMAWMGAMFGKAGDYDRACELVQRAMQINPAHPGWLHFTIFDRHFARGEYTEALAAARRVNLPEFMWMHFAIAAAAGHLGLAREARSAYEEMVRLSPAFADDSALREFVHRWYWPPEMIESLLSGVAAAAGSRPSRTAAPRPQTESASDAPGSLAICVSPFSARGSDAAQALAEGLAEDIATGLSRYGNLKVLARNARYVLEGSVRHADTLMRVNVRVVDTHTGANIWGEGYDRDAALRVFALQDDIASRIVTTVADPTGVLGMAMAAALVDKPYHSMTAAELVVRFHVYTAQVRLEEHARLREAFERTLQREPNSGEGWACVAQLYGQEHALGMNPLPDSRARERRAAERAVELSPQNPWAWTAMARSHMFARDLAAMRGAIDRALTLNPLNADMHAHCALFLSNAGDYERAAQLIERAMELKPHHQGWFFFPVFNERYARGDDEGALRAAKQINMPELVHASLSAAAAAGQLGRTSDARPSIEALRQRAPHLLDPAAAREEWAIWVWSEALLDRLVDGFRKALALAEAPQRPASGSGSAVRPGLISVAIAPLSARAAEGVDGLADGLTDDIATGLARFSHLRVLTGERITAQYTLEGTVRKAGAIVRINMRLLDGENGAHVWAETFDRDHSVGVFAIQDEVAARVAATIGDEDGVLVRRAAAALKERADDTLSVDELVLRFHAYSEHFPRQEHARLRDAFERALEREPSHAAGWAFLSMLYAQELILGHNLLPDTIARQRRTAERALELDTMSQPVWFALAMKSTFERDLTSLAQACDRISAINPLSAHFLASCAIFLAFAGELERASALQQRAFALNPNGQGWYHVAPFLEAYHRRDYESALARAKRMNLPAFIWWPLATAAASGQLGAKTDATVAVHAAARAAQVTTAESAREIWRAWVWDAAQVDHLVDGFTKALELADGQP